MSPRERVEVFQLLFRVLVGLLDDRSLVFLKGGGNLRIEALQVRVADALGERT